MVKSLVLRICSIAFCLLTPITARANPVILDPGSGIAFGIVAFWAFVVEAGIVALLLTVSGLAPLRVFGCVFATNLTVFCFLFFPLLRHVYLPALEALVILADAVAIKILAGLDSFQLREFIGISWLRAGLIAFAGNSASFFVGVLATRSPWEQGPGED